MPKKKSKAKQPDKLSPEQIKQIREASSEKLGQILATPTKGEVIGHGGTLRPDRITRLMRSVALHELVNRPGFVGEEHFKEMTGGELADISLKIRRQQIELWRKKLQKAIDLKQKKGQI